MGSAASTQAGAFSIRDLSLSFPWTAIARHWRELIELKKRFDTALGCWMKRMPVGVIGLHGRGLAAEENLSNDVDVQMGP